MFWDGVVNNDLVVGHPNRFARNEHSGCLAENTTPQTYYTMIRSYRVTTVYENGRKLRKDLL